MPKEQLQNLDQQTPEDAEISEINETLLHMSAHERIQWVHNRFPSQEITYTTSGGRTSAVLPTIVSEALRAIGKTKPINVVFIDTLTYGGSTLKQVEQLAELGKKGGYVVRRYAPLLTLAELHGRHPEWYVDGSTDSEIARRMLKEGPLDLAFQELGTEIWGSGIAR